MPLQALAPFKTPRRAASSRVAQMINIPAPVGGLNLRDPISAMSPIDAVALDNMIPRQTGTEMRNGTRLYVDDVGYSIESMFAYNALNNNDDKIFAAANGNIYDVTSSPSSVAVSATGSTYNLWWTTQFATGGDMFLLAVSPGAGYYTYSTSTGWVQRTPTNLPTSTLRTVGVWKQRVFFTAENDENIYYFNSVNAIDGNVNSFAMGSLLRSGGYVSSIINWTLDAGIGIDDHLVVVGTQGDIGVWTGTDPDSASTFALKGTWYVGPVPTYGKYFTTTGGDVMILSSLGLQQMSKLVNGQFISQDTGPAAKIQSVLNPLVASYINTPNWDVFVAPSSNVLVIKPPPSSIDTYQQFAMNITTGAWCTFSNMNMNCATILDGVMYYGTSGGDVYKGLYGDKDNVAIDGTGGDLVQADLQTAFNAFGDPGILKRFSLARPVFISSEEPSVKLRMNTQYQYSPVDGSPSFTTQATAIWDTGVWNNAIWAGVTNTYQAYVGVTNLGYYGSLRMKVRGTANTIFTSSHVMFDVGGLL